MKARKYLTIDCDGKNARVTSKSVRVEPYEICLPIDIEIPDAYFQRYQLVAKISVPEPKNPLICEADIETAREAILETTGINLSITVQENEQ